MNNLKLVVIGGGSSYTPELMEGMILKRDSLPISEVVLVDIEEGLDKVAINTALVKRMFHKANLEVAVSYSLNRREALVGADFIMTQFRVGGLAARALDEEIPLKYNLVGQETTGIGGFFKALRTIPVIADICTDIEAICPEAWLINFTNPSGIITEFIQTRTHVKCVGLCNVPINMHYEACEKLGLKSEDVTTNFIGLNHLSFMNHCLYEGKEMIHQVLKLPSKDSVVSNISKEENMDQIAEVMGMMMSPYLQYFYYTSEMVKEEQEKIRSGHGSRAREVMAVESELFEIYKDVNLDEKPKALEERGGARYSEAAIALIDSIYNDRGDIQVVNTLNHQSITDLPSDCVVEVNCKITKSGPVPVDNGPLPKAVAGLIHSVKAYEHYTIEAALTGSRKTVQLALLNHPLVGSILEGMAAFEELLEAHQPYLPVFTQEV